MKSATEEKKNGLQELWRGVITRHSALSKAESARKRRIQKKKEPGTLLQRPILVWKTTLPATKIRFSFSTKRTAAEPPEENIF